MNSDINIVKNWFKNNIINEKGTFSAKKLKKQLLNYKHIETLIFDLTHFCPSEYPVHYRIKLILNDVLEFNKCKNCKKTASWDRQNGKMRQYCSTKCASSDVETRKKVRETSLKKFGVTQIMKSEIFKEKKKQNCLEKYGVENISQLEEVKLKKIKTNLKNWGVENISQSKEIKIKKEQTCLKNNGTKYPAQNKGIFKKQQNTSKIVYTYKDININYQGSYEKFFLEEMDKCGLLNKIKNGKKYEYYFNDKIHSYFVDFEYNNINIEIKSSWTYNENGKNKELEERNKSKWNSVIEQGDEIVILFTKKSISNFINKIKEQSFI